MPLIINNNMKISLKKITIVTAAVSVLIPCISFAATRMALSDFIGIIMGYLNQGLFLIMGVAVVMFVFYVVTYFMKPGTDRAEAGQYVMYSLIGFFIVLSFWGLVNILQNTFGLQNEYNNPGSWGSFQNLFPTGSSRGTQSSGTGIFQADLRLQVGGNSAPQ
jgi:hypothetical protein